ncbi:MAG TPA: GvpL/GvpF family gas vesicle protein [Pyrinomonadaceae bacterium]|nr:GvpL/GvpF family gas vesicle protein [Pyrinomonadaceae bacterium]
MKLYAYCLAEDLNSLNDATSGISGAPVRLLKIDNLAVLISDVDVVPVTREHALTHAAVVRSILDQTTPLPFRFGTLVTEQQLRNYISTHKPALENKLAHVRGCVEMSVKIIWELPNGKQTDAVNGERQGAGTTFLVEKRREILGDEQRSKQAAEISDWLRAEVTGLTRDEQITLRPSERLLLSAAHLIERVSIGQYRVQLAKARKNRPDLHFLVSGPWPPYSFANIELEFPTQFGVS